MNRKSTNRNGGTGIFPVWEIRGGFTLVEMLVVILIIGILAGLITAAALRARNRAKATAIALEIKQLSMALSDFRGGKDDPYPPDFAGLDSSDINIKSAAQQKVLGYIGWRWRRYTVPDWNTLRSTILLNSYSILDINNMNPATALAFWLGGMPDAQSRLCGFSKDSTNPFNNFDITTRNTSFFDFDPGRIKEYKYYASGIIPGIGQPYIYLRAESPPDSNREYYIRDTSTTPASYTFKSGSASGAKPYWDQRTKGWLNYKSYQILCCGLDGKFGKENVYPTGLITGAGVPTSSPDLRADVMGTDSITPKPFPTGNFDHLDDQNNFCSGTISDDLP